MLAVSASASLLFLCFAVKLTANNAQTCPDDDPNLIVWSPGIQPTLNYVIDGQKMLLRGNAMVNTLTIQNNGSLVIEDRGAAGDTFYFSTKYILIQTGGEMHIGSESCKYLGKLDILLWGKSTDIEEVEGMGKKVIAVAPTGTLEIHGPWKLSWTLLSATLPAGSGSGTILTLADDASSWRAGDRIVIASTDYNMYQAEEFVLEECGSDCAPNQVKITESPLYTHFGQVSGGVDMRAEVGLLTRDIKIHGEVQTACYADNQCQFFDYDTFGGQTQFMVGFKNVHVEGIELYNMGQQVLGSYPIHFHRDYDVDEAGGYTNPTYARQLSIHDCFSRCVTVHSTFGLTVEDVVGYKTLGHCFFLEDGNEQRNVLRHNLGLVSQPGTLLPSDRDKNMCESILNGVYGNYTPIAEVECMGVSTFWITHPNNHLINNAAAGSVDVGIHIVFHREPTGMSIGTLPPFHAERSPLGIFTGNRAHSNRKVGILIDRGVKTSAASASEPSEPLALQDYARYMPSVNNDPQQGRVTAVMDQLVVYKNNQQGLFVRGGDIRVINSQFADNGAALTFASQQTLPHQEGAHQEVWSSIFFGESDNLGNNDNYSVWAPGADGRYRTLPMDVTYPIRGVQIYDGPILVNTSSFYRFVPTSERNSSAIGFFLQNSGQNTPLNSLNLLNFDANTQRLYFGSVGGAFGSYDRDGDLTQIVRDLDGTTTGTFGVHAIRRDNWLMRFASCTDNAGGLYAICSGGDFGQLYINATTKSLNLIGRSESYPSNPLTFTGANRDDSSSPTRTQFQPVVRASETYLYEWSDSAALVTNIILTLHNLPATTFTYAKLVYPVSNLSFNITYKEWDQLTNTVKFQQQMVEGNTNQVQNDNNGLTYNWDATSRQLYLKMMNRYAKPAGQPSYYCAEQGCEQVHVQANLIVSYM